jgi:hypothetical protein
MHAWIRTVNKEDLSIEESREAMLRSPHKKGLVQSRYGLDQTLEVLGLTTRVRRLPCTIGDSYDRYSTAAR